MPKQSKTKVGPLWPYAILFLIGFPIGGALFGYVFFLVFDFVLGPLRDIGLKISVLIWVGIGAASGIYATYTFQRYDRVLERAKSTDV
jgi:hypothetical protein